MPYKVAKQGKKYCVAKQDGSAVPGGCHSTKAAANKHMQALYSNVGDAKKSRSGIVKGRIIPLRDYERIQREFKTRIGKTPRIERTFSLDTSKPCDFVPVRSMREPEEVEGYLAVWGSPEQRDCYGTYFSKDAPPAMDLDFLPFPLRYGHGQDEQIGPGAIGRVISVWLDEKGIAFRALLDKAHAAYSRIASEISRGVLGVSTGVPDYLADFSEDGRFVSWPITADVSLTDKPCEYRMPAVAAVRSLDGQHIQLEIKPVAPREAVAKGDPRDCGCDEQAGAATGETPSIVSNNTKRTKTMAAKPQPTPAVADNATPAAATKEKRVGGLTLATLGLDANATLGDVYSALCALLGDNAANAIMEDVMGPDLDAEPSMMDDSSADDSTMDEREDPEADNRPEDYMGTTNKENITEGKEGDAARSGSLAEQLQRMIKSQKASATPRSAKKTASVDRRVIELEAQNKLLRQMALRAPVEDQPTPRQDRRERGEHGAPRISQIDVRDLRYDGQRAEDLCYAIKTLDAAKVQPSDSLIRAAAYKIATEIEKSTPIGSDVTVNFFSPFRSRDDVMKTDVKYLRRNYRANEVMGDANTNFGSNYIGVFYDTSLWLKVRAMPIWRELEARGMEEKVIPVGYASDVIPLEGADFTWYRVPETVDTDSTGRPKINIPASKAGTSSATLTVRTLGALVYYSVLMEEDSIVPMASELNRKATVQSQEQIEYVLFNGDTATGTANLNSKNVSLAAGDVTNFTVADGILKTAIVANAGAAARAASGLSDLDFQLLFGLLGNNGITGSDPTKLMFAIDPQTGLALDRLPIVKTKDINSAATVEKGHAIEMYGVPIFRSGQIFLADSTGYIDANTAANNKFGRIACVRPDQWVVGFKRQVTMEFFRDVPGQSNGMVITMRLGLQTRDNTQAASASYNLTVK